MKIKHLPIWLLLSFQPAQIGQAEKWNQINSFPTYDECQNHRQLVLDHPELRFQAFPNSEIAIILSTFTRCREENP